MADHVINLARYGRPARGGGVSGREGVPGHELLHQGKEQLEALIRYEQTTTLA